MLVNTLAELHLVDVFHGRRRPNYEREGPLPGEIVGHADNRRVRYGGVSSQYCFDIGWYNLVSLEHTYE